MKNRFTAVCRLSILIISVVLIAASTRGVESARLQNLDRCTVRKIDNGWWFVAPNGKPFFSLGICEFNHGADKEKYDAARPLYAGLRHYDSIEEWSDANLSRLKSWGFTTLGGWSDFKTLKEVREHDLWMTPVISLGARSGSPWFDMWDSKVVRRIDELAKETIVPLGRDRRIIGYYSDNEIGWWNAILWKMAMEQPATSGQRQRLVRIVRDKYANDWNALLKDFEPQNAKSWDELERGGMLWLRPGGSGIRAMREFLSVVAERYYALMRDAIRKQDPAALYLGDRYQSFYYPELATAGRQHLDVISTNLNASWNDGTFLSSFLDTLHALSDKPIIVSEFYMAAAENSSGNKNSVGGFPTVATQRERQESLTNTLRSLARLPYVVGADWFQYYDEPTHGRQKDGEDYNFGLVDIHDRPYTEVTSTFASLDLAALKAAPKARRVDASAGVPPAPPEPLGNFRPTTALKHWDRRRGLVPAVSQHPLGDLYVCWSPTALYLATIVVDVVEPDYYRSGEIPNVDRALWTVNLDRRPTIRAQVGAGKEALITEKAIRSSSLSGIYHDVRCITAIEIPAKFFGKERFAAGDRISLESTFETFGRADRIDWKGDFVFSK
jgi:hypothetical protein